jgi:hypothetical protein
LVNLFIQLNPKAPSSLVLDMDAYVKQEEFRA